MDPDPSCHVAVQTILGEEVKLAKVLEKDTMHHKIIAL